jgi:threonine dehydrogenase-like Zn-dependent dehydrogenase
MTGATTVPSAPLASRTQMRAAVLSAPRRLEVRMVDVGEPGPHEVRVRVRAVGLCGTDLHIYGGDANYHRDSSGRLISLEESPQILGHEIAGIIDAAGSEVPDLSPGDPVVIDQGRTCVGERRDPPCEYCRTGDSHQCAQYREHGITGLPGGFAEYVTVPAVNAVGIRTSIDFAIAALSEPLGCVLHACDMMLRAPSRFPLVSGGASERVRTVVVFGGGPSGILFVQYLRSVIGFDGALLVSEPSRSRRAIAERFGAEAVPPEQIAAVVRERSTGRGAELVIEASGAGPVFEVIPQLARKQATVVLYGHGHAGASLEALNGVQFLEPTLLAPTGASGGFLEDGRPATYEAALRFIERGRIDVASLITHRYTSLDDLPRAFGGDHRSPEYVKGVLTL